MRKLLSILSVTALALTLTGCIPSGNIVGKANFTTLDSTIANPGDLVTINFNGGITATPNGLRVRITKANFVSNGSTFTASKLNDLNTNSGFSLTRDAFALSRLKGKNPCGSATGYLTDGRQFVIALFNPSTGIVDYINNVFQISVPANSQILAVEGNDLYWVGYAPANSLKIGGRNLCNSVD